jgi:ParB-like chromosome segregation protein Spo0J
LNVAKSAKSPTEQIRDLSGELLVVAERVRQLTENANDLEQAERRMTDRLSGIETELALLRQKLEDHLKRFEETDRKRWAVIGIAIGALLSLIVNAAVTLMRK